MAGVKALRKIQMGKETTAGTAVAATTVWRGLGTIEDTREVVHADEDVGILMGTDRAYIPVLGGAIEFEEVEATYEQIMHIFEAGIKKVGTPVTDTGGSGKIYTYPFPTTSQNTVQTYTIEAGDDEQAEEMEYSFVEKFTISGAPKEAVKISADWVGRQVTTTTYTGSISTPDVEEILFGDAILSIGSGSSTWYNAPEITNTLLGFNLEVTTGRQGVFTGDNKYFTFDKGVQPEVTLEVTFEHNSAALNMKEFWRAKASTVVRLLFEGSALGTAGATYSKKSLIIDLVGKWEKFDKIDEMDGNDIIVGTLRARYNSTVGSAGRIIVVNQVATVP